MWQNSFIRFFLNIVLLLFNFFCESDLHPALALIPGTEGTYIIVNVDEFIDETCSLTKTIVLACAQDSSHLLIIVKIIEKTNDFDDKQIQICGNKVIPSKIINPETKDIEIGYEIYDKNNLLQKFNLFPMTKLENMNENVGWVQVLIVRNHDSRVSENYISYELNSPDLQTNEDNFCSNVRKHHDFGERSNDKYYSKKHQKAVLNYESRSALNLFTGNKAPRNYFEKAYFASHNSFKAYYAKMATCFDINSVPMWESIFKGSWKNVDKFIINTRNKLPNYDFKIYKGTYEGLRLPGARNNEILYLDSKRKQIDVPLVYWILVISTSYEPVMVEYSILIFIHNDLYSSSISLICNNVCEKYGWDVYNDDFQKGMTYCCEIKDEIMKTLSISYFPITKTMNLKELMAS